MRKQNEVAELSRGMPTFLSYQKMCAKICSLTDKTYRKKANSKPKSNKTFCIVLNFELTI